MTSAGLTLPKDTPRTFGIVLYTQFEVLDVFGPVEALNTISRNLAPTETPMKCITFGMHAAKPIRSGPPTGVGSLFSQSFLPDASFDDDAKLAELDVLIVPGGLGPADAAEKQAVINFIQRFYNRNVKHHKNRYLFTVCTGANLAAFRSSETPEVPSPLEGRVATTNKSVWAYFFGQQKLHPATYWVAQARWVPQGDVWTTSGVSAGTDGMIAWIAQVYGEDKAQFACNGMEYNRQANPDLDPFAALYGAKDVPATQADVKWIIKA
ncbi:class I glutamine amidotransferase-like protein [Roridomyces roridus]|uniref:Class I glutamine amidotransferase-like protein n=1 Tax=Roridomyces roridus TaxID=1738132 RepID=A0AAD7FJJ4_9AGAR|nr:class I glutamine amidotransferase-like protein [Roridomyces roridus]